MSVEIVTSRPPIYETIIAFGLRFNPNSVLFAYEGKIWNPGGQEVSEDLKVHEGTHLAQHLAYPGGSEKWWGRYLTDPYFRLEQEAEAYATQYAYICTYVKDCNRRSLILHDLASYLAGPMYGNTVSRTAAVKMIKDQLI